MAEDTVSSTHPLLPPTSEDDRLDRLRLLRSRRVGISTYNRLMAEHGTARAALAALPEVASAAGLADYKPCPESVVEQELQNGARAAARLLWQGERDYPAALNDLEDAPPCLWVKGHVRLIHQPAIALVGARNASSLGTRMARILARDLGRKDYTIVSGLARGVDTAAHLASLETGTIAVFAGGIDVIYPSENTGLGRDIAEKGLVVAEHPPGTTPVARHFPARNRLIAGLARAMVVVEAAMRSGSITAAKHALDQGREILAVPGHPLEPRAAGCNHLIRDGAKLVRSAEDILEALSPISAPELPLEDPMPRVPAGAPQTRSLRETASLHSEILARLDPAPMAEDALIRALGLPAQKVAAELTDLELDGQIQRQSGGILRRLP